MRGRIDTHSLLTQICIPRQCYVNMHGGTDEHVLMLYALVLAAAASVPAAATAFPQRLRSRGRARREQPSLWCSLGHVKDDSPRLPALPHVSAAAA